MASRRRHALAQPAQAFRDTRVGDSAVAEDYSGLPGGRCTVRGKAVEGDLRGARPLGDFSLEPDASEPEAGGEMHPRDRRHRREPAGELALQCPQDSHVACGVRAARLAQMTREQAVFDERREGRLRRQRRVPSRHVARRPQGVPERRRSDEEAQPQPRQECLRKGAHVDDASVPVDCLQCLEGPAAEAELAVVVVLQDHRVPSLRPLEECQSARVRHGHAKGKLMRGRDVDEARIVRQRVHRADGGGGWLLR